ncbi:hypothetical protein ACQKO7_21075 [Pseudomonas putida]|uniref:hypothetical protein n=1 Tax=Pseudomonas putida TaxID=303 RepID=UPI003D084288
MSSKQRIVTLPELATLVITVLGVVLYCTEQVGLWGMFVILMLPNICIGLSKRLSRLAGRT